MLNNAYLGVFFSSVIIIIDQLSKLWISKNYIIHQAESLLKLKYFGLNFCLAHNTGVAFSLFDNASGWQNGMFLTIAILVSMVILILIVKGKINNKSEKLALLLILSGSCGNILDRIFYGYVIDFIDFYVVIKNQSCHWYIFNMADSYICIGALVFIIRLISGTQTEIKELNLKT